MSTRSSISACQATKTPVICDIGFGNLRLGLAGALQPALASASRVGRVRGGFAAYLPIGGETELVDWRHAFCGEEVYLKRGILKRRYVMRGGRISRNHKRDFVDLLRWGLGPDGTGEGLEGNLNVLGDGSETLEDRPMLFADPTRYPDTDKPPEDGMDRIPQVLFEEFRVPALCIANAQALALFGDAFGEDGDLKDGFDPGMATSGLVVDIGDSSTTVTPLIRGRVCNPSRVHRDFGGTELKWHLCQLLSDRGFEFATSPELRWLERQLIRKHCFVAEDFEKERLAAEKTFVHDLDLKYDVCDPPGTLPVKSERFVAMEVFFDPRRIHSGDTGLSSAIHDAITGYTPGEPALAASSLPSRHLLWRNVVLTGGMANIPGFAPRILRDLRLLGVVDGSVNVRVLSNPQMAAWKGGSIVATARDAKIWVTREQYEEHGLSCFWHTGVSRDGIIPVPPIREETWKSVFLDTPLLEAERVLLSHRDRDAVERILFAVKSSTSGAQVCFVRGGSIVKRIACFASMQELLD